MLTALSIISFDSRTTHHISTYTAAHNVVQHQRTRSALLPMMLQQQQKVVPSPTSLFLTLELNETNVPVVSY